MDIADVARCIDNWRADAQHWVTVDPPKARRLQRLAEQMSSMLEQDQCSMAPIKSIDLIKQRQLSERDALRHEQKVGQKRRKTRE